MTECKHHGIEELCTDCQYAKIYNQALDDYHSKLHCICTDNEVCHNCMLREELRR